MNSKDLVKVFKKGAWQDKQEVEVFILTAKSEPFDVQTVTELLDVLCKRRIGGGDETHRLRCQVFSHLVSDNEDKRLFEVYLKGLKDGDRLVRSMLEPLLKAVNNVEAHPKLCALLRTNDRELRISVVKILKEIGRKTAVNTLGELVRERNFPARVEVMDLVTPMGASNALPTLTAVLEVGSLQEQVRALRHLGDVRYMAKARRAVLKTVLPYLKDENERLTTQAITTFCNHCTEEEYFDYIGPLLESENVNIIRASIAGMKRFPSPQVINELDRKLRRGPHLVRMQVIDTLEAIATDDVLPPLVDALSYKQQALRNRAGEVLSKLSREGTLDIPRVIMWLLRSRDVNVRRMAVGIAQKVKDPAGELWPKLLVYLRDEDWWVRERVIDAVVEMAGMDLTAHMVKLLADPNDVIRRFAVDALLRLKDKRALGALVKTAQNDTDWWTREKAMYALGELGDTRVVPYIVDVMRRDEEVQRVAIQVLGKLGDAMAAPIVAELLMSEDPDVRLDALDCLDGMGATAMAAQVKPLVRDPEARVSRAAKDLLARWKIEVEMRVGGARDKAIFALDRLLIELVDRGGDDLILAPNKKPYIKRFGQVEPLGRTVLTEEQVTALLNPQLTFAQREELDAARDVDYSYDVRSEGHRFRVNVFKQRGGLGAVFRKISGDVPALSTLGIPEVIKSFADLSFGLVLVGGPTGSGKSTTLAALIDHINGNTDRHVISLEDPIEVVHESQKGLVNQRELGTHTRSFEAALRSTLRQDPDVILMGELRDIDTIRFAIAASDTGHLVFGTVHTVSADTTVDRLINAFPAGERSQVRSALSENLRAVVCQYLLVRRDVDGRVLAVEVMINNDAIANLIRKGKTFQIPSTMATSGERGMQLMDNELMRLYKENKISATDAYMKANSKAQFEELLGDLEKSGPGVKKGDLTEEEQARSPAEPVAAEEGESHGAARLVP